MSIINSVEQLRNHLPVGAANSIKSLPNFSVAEERYLLPIIGASLYDALQTPNSDAVQLLEKCRAVVAPFAYLLQLPFIQTTITDNGLIAMTAEGQRKAFQWEYRGIEEALTNQGYAAQEMLILYLQTNKAKFPTWSESPYNDSSDFAFIRNGAELGKAITITQPHRSFMMLRPLFAVVGELTIQELLGTAFYNALSAKIFAGTISSAAELQLLKLIRMTSARLVMEQASTELNIRFNSGNGFTVVDSLKDEPDAGRKNARDTELQKFASLMKKDAAALMEKISQLLDETASAELFPEYFNSGKYTNPHEVSPKVITDRKGMVCL
jgi:hypothetical protein